MEVGKVHFLDLNGCREFSWEALLLLGGFAPIGRPDFFEASPMNSLLILFDGL